MAIVRAIRIRNTLGSPEPRPRATITTRGIPAPPRRSAVSDSAWSICRSPVGASATPRS